MNETPVADGAEAPLRSGPDAPAAQPDDPHPAVGSALAALRTAAGAPLAERPALLEAVHARLAEALGAVDGS